MRTPIVGAVALCLAAIGGGAALAGGDEPATRPSTQPATQPATQKTDLNVKVMIGDSASSAKGTLRHDITVAALKEGRKEYEIVSPRKKTYKITLTKTQLAMILEGSTVTVPTVEGNQKVVISLAGKAKSKKKG